MQQNILLGGGDKMDLFGVAEKESEKLSCKGIVFKASVNHFQTKKNGFGFQVRLIPIKKLSCPGCQKCCWQSFEFSEVNNDWPIIGIENCKDGKLYEVSACNEATDWETGQVDSWDLELLEIKTVAK